MKKTTITKEYNEDGKLLKEVTVIEESSWEEPTYPYAPLYPNIPLNPFEPTYNPPWTPVEPTITKPWVPTPARITWTDDNTSGKRGLHYVTKE